jgi:hypothetical protein
MRPVRRAQTSDELKSGPAILSFDVSALDRVEFAALIASDSQRLALSGAGFRFHAIE